MWQPILLGELNELIINQLAECTSIARAQYEANAVSPQKWTLSPWGDDGDGFWVVVVFGGVVLWCNDIEGGFNTSLYLEEGPLKVIGAIRIRCIKHYLACVSICQS